MNSAATFFRAARFFLVAFAFALVVIVKTAIGSLRGPLVAPRSPLDGAGHVRHRTLLLGRQVDLLTLAIDEDRGQRRIEIEEIVNHPHPRPTCPSLWQRTSPYEHLPSP